MVDDRFRRRTWRHVDFDADELVEVRRRAGTSVSVVVPARDEQATVGDVVATAVGLRERGLIDQVLVVDGGSTDATVERARAAGAAVVAQAKLLPEAGPGHGKGDALWKGLAATTGDLVVFLDADLRDPDPRYVVGLLGPLLTVPEVALVKACYDRPLRTAGQTAAGGGRVTELTARPLLAAFWPQLSWLAQPLAGEYAGRRAVLEAVPFAAGYGVELALLIDVVERFGDDAIGQVDVGQRLHDHQPLPALGRMAAEIVGVAAARLVSDGRLSGGSSGLLPQPDRAPDGRLTLRVHRVNVDERPPLAQLRTRA
ncbi:MAG TPA: glucosyl-3-phosphoglycerate synthase [Nitriliruptorales bacterium]|nr:glucosyl-3-phosphoglycerate synthase [Nitriliruptorales bacterium]